MRQRYGIKYLDGLKCFIPNGKPARPGKEKEPYRDAPGEPQDIEALTDEQRTAVDSICGAMVKSAFSRYSRVRNRSGLTGAEAARRVLDNNGLSDVEIVPISGSLTDNYDPRGRVLSLSTDVYNVDSVSAVSVA